MPTCSECEWFNPNGPATTWEFYPKQAAVVRECVTPICALNGPVASLSQSSNVTASFADKPTTKDHPSCKWFERRKV